MAENGAKRIRLGMVGGGAGAFIGAVHRMAARLDGHYNFVAGALAAPGPFSFDPVALSGARADQQQVADIVTQAVVDHLEAVEVAVQDADPGAGVEVRAALADDDLAGLDDLAAEALDAEVLGVGVAPVARRGCALFVCHC